MANHEINRLKTYGGFYCDQNFYDDQLTLRQKRLFDAIRLPAKWNPVEGVATKLIQRIAPNGHGLRAEFFELDAAIEELAYGYAQDVDTPESELQKLVDGYHELVRKNSRCQP